MEELAESLEAGSTTVFFQRVRCDDASEQSLPGAGWPRTLSNVHHSPGKGVVILTVEFRFSCGCHVQGSHAQSFSRELVELELRSRYC